MTGMAYMPAAGRRPHIQVISLFGEDLFEAWSQTIARAALYTLTDEHIRHAALQAENDRRHVAAYDSSTVSGST